MSFRLLSHLAPWQCHSNTTHNKTCQSLRSHCSDTRSSFGFWHTQKHASIQQYNHS